MSLVQGSEVTVTFSPFKFCFPSDICLNSYTDITDSICSIFMKLGMNNMPLKDNPSDPSSHPIINKTNTDDLRISVVRATLPSFGVDS